MGDGIGHKFVVLRLERGTGVEAAGGGRQTDEAGLRRLQAAAPRLELRAVRRHYERRVHALQSF